VHFDEKTQMRKLLYSALLTTIGTVQNPTSIPATTPASVTRLTPASSVAKPPSPASEYQNDPRLHALRRFFGRLGCPAKAYSHVFLEAADNYSLDWRLLPSISFVESTCGKWARNNNLFGWDSGNARFPTPSAGIHKVGFILANSRRYKDKKLDELLAVYNPNVEYPAKVKAVMQRIQSFWPGRMKLTERPNTPIQTAENHH
jgi:hypothetical protein